MPCKATAEVIHSPRRSPALREHLAGPSTENGGYMKTIPLTQNQVAIVDDADFDILNAHKWHSQWDQNARSFYASRNSPVGGGKRTIIRMHRIILGLTDPKIFGDHINHNSLDNRRSNLRAATSSQNSRNRRGADRNSTTGARGVYIRGTKYRSYIELGGKQIYLGTFATIHEASAAYAAANKKHYGEFGGNF